MKISPNGAPILDGRGLQSVKERIQRAFEQAHSGAPKEIPLVEQEIEIVEEVKLDVA